MLKQRRLKKRKQIVLEAVNRGINTPGGLAKAVYGASARDRKARARAVKLRYLYLRWKLPDAK